eukprot:g5587.t1
MFYSPRLPYLKQIDRNRRVTIKSQRQPTVFTASFALEAATTLRKSGLLVSVSTIEMLHKCSRAESVIDFLLQICEAHLFRKLIAIALCNLKTSEQWENMRQRRKSSGSVVENLLNERKGKKQKMSENNVLWNVIDENTDASFVPVIPASERNESKVETEEAEEKVNENTTIEIVEGDLEDIDPELAAAMEAVSGGSGGSEEDIVWDTAESDENQNQNQRHPPEAVIMSEQELPTTFSDRLTAGNRENLEGEMILASTDSESDDDDSSGIMYDADGAVFAGNDPFNAFFASIRRPSNSGLTEDVYQLFPRLAQRRRPMHTLGTLLSGGALLPKAMAAKSHALFVHLLVEPT